MPVDVEPASSDVHVGFVLRDVTSPDGPLAVAVTRMQMPGEPLYTSHFVTCPDAATWRKS
jgi:hypothetical protein